MCFKPALTAGHFVNSTIVVSEIKMGLKENFRMHSVRRAKYFPFNRLSRQPTLTQIAFNPKQKTLFFSPLMETRRIIYSHSNYSLFYRSLILNCLVQNKLRTINKKTYLLIKLYKMTLSFVYYV